MRVAKVMITLDMLSIVLGGKLRGDGGYQIETDAPEDLKVIGLAPGSDDPPWCYVYCESETFEPVESLEDAPEIEPFTYTLVTRFDVKDQEPAVGQRCIVFDVQKDQWIFAYWVRDVKSARGACHFEERFMGRQYPVTAFFWLPAPMDHPSPLVR